MLRLPFDILEIWPLTGGYPNVWRGPRIVRGAVELAIDIEYFALTDRRRWQVTILRWRRRSRRPMDWSFRAFRFCVAGREEAKALALTWEAIFERRLSCGWNASYTG